MSENNTNVPKIRFPGFTDAWEQRLMSDVKDVRDGTHDSPKYHSEGHPLVTSKNLTEHGLDMTNVSLISDEDFNAINHRSKVDVGDIIFGMIGTIGNPIILKRDDFAIKNVALIKRDGEVENEFLIQLLKSPLFDRYIKKENAGGTQKFLGLSQIRNFEFLVPSKAEQEKISKFFYELDHLIALHQRKLGHLQDEKKSLLQKMFPKNGADFPEIRFPGFTLAWEQRKLGEISEKVTEKNKNNIYSETLTNSAVFGIINQRDFFDKDISNEKNLFGYYVVRPDDFVYNPRISNHAPVGPIKRNKLGRTGVMSPLYYVFRTHNVDKTYLEKYFSSNHWQIFMKLNGDSGARSDRFAIKDSIFRDMPIPIPSIKEQTKIGNFFDQLDHLITIHQRKLNHLQEQKKSLLQQMFV
jgi:type I restriction enzyme, S subunit